MDKLNFALLGAGHIAHKMAATVANMPELNLYAVAARDKARAEEFAAQYGIQRAFGSYEEMVQDDNVQLVYVNTPHSHHYQHAALCLNHGRPVLCEKAFTANAKQAKELIELSHSKNLFLAEAIWTRYLPLAKTLRQLVDGGAIGTPAMVTASLGAYLLDSPRMAEPALAGGALLDLGMYVLTFASIAFGNGVKKVVSTAQLTDKGVDGQNTITLDYGEGRMACLYSTMLASADSTGRVLGSRGVLEADTLNSLARIRVLNKKGEETAVYTKPEEQVTGFEYEVKACVKALREGRLETEEMPHAETLRIMEMMDAMRAEWGVKYPFE